MIHSCFSSRMTGWLSLSPLPKVLGFKMIRSFTSEQMAVSPSKSWAVPAGVPLESHPVSHRLTLHDGPPQTINADLPVPKQGLTRSGPDEGTNGISDANPNQTSSIVSPFHEATFSYAPPCPHLAAALESKACAVWALDPSLGVSRAPSAAMQPLDAIGNHLRSGSSWGSHILRFDGVLGLIMICLGTSQVSTSSGESRPPFANDCRFFQPWQLGSVFFQLSGNIGAESDHGPVDVHKLGECMQCFPPSCFPWVPYDCCSRSRCPTDWVTSAGTAVSTH